MAIQSVVKQIRQRCTVRQDFESLLYISDRLRPKYKAEVISQLPKVRSSEEELGVLSTKVISQPGAWCKRN